MSFVLRPHSPQAGAWQLGFVAALAVADALVSLGMDPRLKWPNDVLLGQDKVAGVLVEALPSGSPSFGDEGSHSVPWVAIVGIGLNVNQDEFPGVGDFLHPPTSLRRATGHAWGVEEVIQAVAAALTRRTREWENCGFGPICGAWRSRLATGAALRRGEETATLLDVGADGSARIRRADGTFARWTSVEEGRTQTAPDRVQDSV